MTSVAYFLFNRQYDVSDETALINMVKEKLCYVSQSFVADLTKTKLYDCQTCLPLLCSSLTVPIRCSRGRENVIKREYVLPDNVTTTEGYVLVCFASLWYFSIR